ncbi:hypothetical protein LguiB_027229 [Lonicera macranthoides]
MSSSYDEYFGQDGNEEEMMLMTQMMANLNRMQDASAIVYNQEETYNAIANIHTLENT